MTNDIIIKDYAFGGQNYSLTSTRNIGNRIVQLNINLDGAYHGQSSISASQYSGTKFNQIVHLEGLSEAIDPLIVSYVSSKDERKVALDAVADVLIERVVDLFMKWDRIVAINASL
ncbi:MAG TPA: hypothetical protein VFU07_05595 [Candidatus Lumbricidophila sp.]|nr:hypothetical protein [Candidatus Lumbricidophila sp.]